MTGGGDGVVLTPAEYAFEEPAAGGSGVGRTGREGGWYVGLYMLNCLINNMLGDGSYNQSVHVSSACDLAKLRSE